MKTLVNTYLKYNPTPPPIIYHYCSTEVMLSILDTESIWLSDSTKTNDKSEINWLLNNISDVFEECLDKLKEEFDTDVMLKVSNIAKNMISYSSFYKNPNFTGCKMFLSCFSENGDLLSQWRAYSNNGNGVSLGFSSKYFDIFRNGNLYEFTKVIYDLSTTKKFLHSVIDEQFKYIILDCLERNTIESGPFSLEMQLGMLINTIYREGFIFKNLHFNEENEWRLYRFCTQSNYDDSDGMDDYGYSEMIEGIFTTNNNVGEFTRKRLKFGSTENDIKCHLEIGFEKIKSNIIKEIIIGPKCKVDPFDLKLFLAEHNYLEDILDESIKIKHSEIPYV